MSNEKKELNKTTKLNLNLPRKLSFELPKEEIINRINRLKSFLDNNDIFILYSNFPSNHPDAIYQKFRQNSDFYYLTGLNIAPAILVITFSDVILFYNEPDPEEELWTGIKPNHNEIKNYLEFITDILPFSEFKEKIFQNLENKTKIYYPFGINQEYDYFILNQLEHRIRRSRSNVYFPTTIIHAYEILFELRIKKTPYEINIIKEIMEITKNAHINVWKNVKPGMFEYELEAILLQTFYQNNADFAYPSIVASGSNACILHYTSNNAKINTNDLILIDAGARKYYLNTDITRTFPAKGKFNSIQKHIYQAVLEAQNKAIEFSKPGYCMEDSHFAAINVLIDFLKEEKILKESKDEILEKELYKPYYMHRTGHWLGYDVHDRGFYLSYSSFNKDKICTSRLHKEFKKNSHLPYRKFEPNMICTVEPGLYFSPGLDTVPEEWKGIGIRIEDDILITENEPEILSKNIPKIPEEIETIMQK
ncbi:MAG: Xaa-Pro aminopeptidase [Leptospiraceae bacterium]|nr:MAG: Xaa-Pro aminopeptidase [Leptospiraceae bacterium]